MVLTFFAKNQKTINSADLSHFTAPQFVITSRTTKDIVFRLRQETSQDVLSFTVKSGQILYLNEHFVPGTYSFRVASKIGKYVVEISDRSLKLGNEDDLDKVLNNYITGNISAVEAAANMRALGYRNDWLIQWINMKFASGVLSYPLYESLKKQFLGALLTSAALGDETLLNEVLARYISGDASVVETAAKMHALGYRNDWLINWLDLKFAAGAITYALYEPLKRQFLYVLL
jgi:hypothetical protein